MIGRVSSVAVLSPAVSGPASSASLVLASLPPNAKWKHFRVKDAGGQWHKLRRIRSLEDLETEVRRTGGVDLYATATDWLVPDKLGHRTTTGSVTTRLLLGGLLAFDVDSPTLSVARRSAALLYEVMRPEASQYTFWKWQFTGKKGFRLLYTESHLNIMASPHHREPARVCRMTLLKDRLTTRLYALLPRRQAEAVLACWDWRVPLNPRCVIRLEDSQHSGTGLHCTALPLHLLHAPLETLCLAWRPSESPPAQWGAMTSRDPGLPHTLPGPRSHLACWGDDSADGGSSPPPPGDPLLVFASTVVTGTPCHIPVFRYPKTRRRFRRELRRLGERFHLGPILVYDGGKYWYGVSLKVCQDRHLARIMQASTSADRTSRRVPLGLPHHATLNTPLRGSLSKAHSLLLLGRTFADSSGRPDIHLLRGIPPT